MYNWGYIPSFLDTPYFGWFLEARNFMVNISNASGYILLSQDPQIMIHQIPRPSKVAHVTQLDDGWPESEKDVFQAALSMVVVKNSRW